jgi:hypothetical protein
VAVRQTNSGGYAMHFFRISIIIFICLIISTCDKSVNPINTYRDESIKEIPADTLVSTFINMKLIGPYSSEFDLRKNLDGISFRTPWVGVYVITRNRQCFIIRFFRAPGPRIGEQDWDELLII